ncbi:MAG: TIM barrel protein [Chloroflexales bacterium]
MMPTIYVGNAPCSWGTLEFAGLEGERISYPRMLDELGATGYTGTELGDWGYLPTTPAVLRAELAGRGLSLTGAFVPVALRDHAAHAPGVESALRVARLLAAASEGAETRPFLVLADRNGDDRVRTAWAGRVRPDQSFGLDEWRIFARGAEAVARAVRDETGLRTVFHHHCAGFVETPAEIAALLDLTDPALLGLVFDTGHYVYGAGATDGAAALEGLERFAERVWYVHFKDCDPQVAAQARAGGIDYFTAIRRGLFCELGRGCVDFAAVTGWLRGHDYHGYITVEQDVLPGMGAPVESARRNRAYLRGVGL